MEGTYNVCLDGKRVGTVILKQRGLYCQISCRCTVTDKPMLHLLLENGSIQEDLGLMIPTGTYLELRKQIPMKRMGEGKPTFFLQERNTMAEAFIPVIQDEPFPYLHRLPDARFGLQGENKGIFLKKKTAEKAQNRG